jgi:hypothetical protein
MEMLLLWIGRVAGLVGTLVALGAVVLRAQGLFTVGHFQTGTVLQAAIALMLIGCLGYIAAIGERSMRMR